jgi:hypothetical protein
MNNNTLAIVFNCHEKKLTQMAYYMGGNFYRLH